MKKILASMVLMSRWRRPSYAALDVGDAAPKLYSAGGARRQGVKFTPRRIARQGAVVLYFFPAAFSVGCSIEAHEFAEAINKFESFGATVIGVSTDDIDTLGKFSVQACQGKFPVASDNTQSVIKSLRRRAWRSGPNTPTASRT
jgi:peroxiredoxin